MAADTDAGWRSLFASDEPVTREPGAAAALARMRREMFDADVAPPRLGRLTILERVGRGGMGVVYAAYDPDLDRRVAVKVLHLRSEKAAERALREGRALAQVTHPNVVVVHGVQKVSGRVHIVMEYVDGGTMRRWMGSPRAWQEVVRLFVAVGRGLQAAHAAGLVHGDFKPDNVLTDKDARRPRVADFGLASADADASISGTGETDTGLTRGGGTAGYAAPEQVAGERPDARADQFSFCVSLFEALTGRRPFDAEQIRTGRLQLEEPGGVKLPKEVLRILARGLLVAPEARHPSMEALVAALSRTVEPRLVRRAATIAGLLGVGGGLALALGFGLGDPEPSTAAPCTQPDLRLDKIWATGTEAVAGWTDAETASTVVEALESWQAEWHATSNAACRAALVDRTTSEHQYRLQGGCLDRKVAEFEATVSVLGRAAPDRSLDVANALGSPRRCEDPETLARAEPQWPDAEAKATASAMAGRLARVAALRAGGEYAEAETLATALLDEALDNGALALEAEARLQLGATLEWQQRSQEAAKALYRAVWAAEASGHAEVAALGWTRIVEVEANLNNDLEAAARALERGEAAATRFPEPENDLQLKGARAALQFKRGQYRESLQTHRELLQRTVADHGPLAAGTAALRGNIAALLNAVGEHPEALEYARASVETYEATLSETSPALIEPLNVLGLAYIHVDDLTQARQTLSRGLALAEAHTTDDASAAARLLANLASVSMYEKDYRRAADEYGRVLEINRGIFGEDGAVLAADLGNLGVALQNLGDAEQALTHLRRAHTISEKAFGPRHPDTASAASNLARLHIEQGRFAQALERLDTALEIRIERDVAPQLLAATHYDLAKAHRGLGNRTEALAHAGEAAKLARTLTPPNPEFVAAAENFAME